MSEDPVERAWSAGFGDAYTRRNTADAARLRRRTRTWARWLDALGSREPARILEVGCNVGINQRALQLLTGAELWGVEPNAGARETLIGLDVPYLCASPLEFQTVEAWEDDTRGLHPVQSALMVAVPELDGATSPMIFGGRTAGGAESANTKPVPGSMGSRR